MKEKEISFLLEEAKKAIENGGSLTAVFEKTAKATGRAAGSVRNFYYSLVKRANNDESVKSKYPILKSVEIRKKREFSKEDEEKLVRTVDEMTKNGKSVRRAIKELSCGDEKLALRFQNKYRNATFSRRQGGNSSYRRVCAAIDSLVEKLLAFRSADETMIKENERLKSELAMLNAEISGSNIAEYFRRTEKSKSEKK